MAALFIKCEIIVLFCCIFRQVSSEYRVVCYFSNWAQYRRPPYSFSVDDVDPALCTHLILAFAQLTQDTMGLKFIEYNDDITYYKLEKIKLQYPELKILIAVGGYGSKSLPFSKMSSLPEHRQQFINQSIDFVTKFGFDGIDLDWEYPTHQTSQNGETILEEKEFFAQLLKEMRIPFTEAGLIMTAAVSAGVWLIDQAYDVPAMNSYLDFISLMSYDFNGPWNKKTGHSSPLRSDDNLNLEAAAKHWISKGLDKSKLVVGLSTYGRTFNLANSSNTEIGAPIDGAGTHGRYTGEQGIMSYYEVCDVLADPNSAYRKHWLDDQGVPYIEDGNNWIGYEDERSIGLKLDFIKGSGYGGAMLWTLGMDDFPGQCPTSMAMYPILTLVYDAMRASPGSPGEPCLSTVGEEDGYCTDPNSVCDPSTLVCECNDGYRKHRQTCKTVVEPGALCFYSTDVCSNGSTCNRRDQRCVCTGATFVYNKQCLPQSRLYEDCIPEAGGASCSGTLTTCLNTGTCACISGTSDMDGSGVCIYDKQTGGRCDPATAKPCDKYVDRCICNNGKCTCVEFEFCKNRPDGFYADPDDCRKYYRCVSKGTYHLSCSENLFWDNEFTICTASTQHCGRDSLPPSTTTPSPPTTTTTQPRTTASVDDVTIATRSGSHDSGLSRGSPSTASSHGRAYRTHLQLFLLILAFRQITLFVE